MALARYPKLDGRRRRSRQIAARHRRRAPASSSSDRFSEGVARIAAAFYPKPVIVRTSDFKTNEYAALARRARVRARRREPDARVSRRVPLLRPALRGRLRARMRGAAARARGDGAREHQSDDSVLPHGRRRAARARRWPPTGCGRARTGSRSTPCARCRRTRSWPTSSCSVFDGFSIGSNDLTQLTLGLDRDSGTVAHLFDERNDAVRWMIARAIDAGQAGRQADRHLRPGAVRLSRISRHWLVERGIDSISAQSRCGHHDGAACRRGRASRPGRAGPHRELSEPRRFLEDVMTNRIATSLDTLIPRARLVEIHRVDLAARAEAVWQHLRSAELAHLRATRALFALRTMIDRGKEAAAPPEGSGSTTSRPRSADPGSRSGSTIHRARSQSARSARSGG